MDSYYDIGWTLPSMNNPVNVAPVINTTKLYSDTPVISSGSLPAIEPAAPVANGGIGYDFFTANGGVDWGGLDPQGRLDWTRLGMADKAMNQADSLSWLAPAGFGLQAAGTLANAFMGWKNMNQAKKALNFQMDMARKNFNNNVTMLEDARSDRRNNRSAFSGSPTESYRELDRM